MKKFFSLILLILLLSIFLTPYLFASTDYLKTGKMFLSKGKYDEAVKNFELYLDKNRDNYEAIYLLALTYYKKGMTEKALKSLEKALKIKGDYIPAFFLKGEIYKNKGRLKEAETIFSYIIKKEPSFKEAAYNLALILYEIGDYSKSLVFIESVLEGNPEIAEYLELREKIEEKLSIKEKKNIIFDKAQILLFIEKWRLSWEACDINPYLSFYSEKFKWKNGGIKEWRDLKGKIFSESKTAAVVIILKDINVVYETNFVVVRFFQEYSSNTLKDSGLKELKLIVEDNKLKIISENFKKEIDEKK